jgi:release factor glutamine methyltransferase
MTIREALTEAAILIANPDARRDADTLLAHVLGRERAWLLAHPDDSLSATELTVFRALAARRAAREPLQYLTGHQEFYGLDFRVTPDVLIPRPETEHLVEAVLLWATRFHDERTLHIADIGTGSGAIVVALATHLAGADFTATDISAAALAVARENARTHGCEERIRFLECDLLSVAGMALESGFRFDAIASNPPYVPVTDAATMQPEVVLHEPHTALFAGDTGLDIYRRLIPAAYAALREEGLLALEIGHGQRNAIAELLQDWSDVHFVDDYQGIPRVALAFRPLD